MIGRMQKIAFQTSSLATQPTGGGVETMTTVYEAFAWARPTSSNRTFLHNEGVIIDSYNFDVQYTTDFTPTKSHTILYRGKRYAINGITNLQERRRFWRIFAISET